MSTDGGGKSIMTGLRLDAVALAGAASVLSSPLSAQEIRSTATVDLGAAYESNPFLETAQSQGGGSTVIELDPSIFYETEVTSISLSGEARLAYFPDQNRTKQSSSLNFSAKTQASEKVSLNTSASMRTSRSSAMDILLSDPSVLDSKGEFPAPVDIDPTIVGRFRSTSYSVGAGMDYRLSPVSDLTLGASSRWFDNRSQTGRDYIWLNADAAYAMAVAERTIVSFELSAGSVNYANGGAGDAVIFHPSAGMQTRTSTTGRLSLNVGVAIVRTNLPTSGRDTRAYVSGGATFCERAIGGSVCVSANRSAQPTSASGVSSISAVSVGWSSQVSPDGTASLSGRYARNRKPTSLVGAAADRSSELYGAVASYRHRLNDRVSFFVSPSYSKATSKLTQRDANWSIMGGVTLTIGSAR